jgi:hypothetical protein
VAIGLLLGMIVLSYVSFTTGHVLGMTEGSLAASLITINLIGISLWHKKVITVLVEDWHDFKKRYSVRSWQLFGLFLILFCSLFGYLVSGMLTYKDQTYFVQPVHAYGDISLHLGIISSFAFGNNFPPQNPNFSGNQISYPFMVDFITAFFIQPLGLSYQAAMAYTGVYLFSVLIILLAFFIVQLTNSKKVAALALVLFLFNGGFGFLYAWENFLNSGKNIFDFLISLPQDYTAIKELGYWWINVNLSMLLPQRSFLFGFGVALLILSIFLQLKTHFQMKSYILGILLLAFLPLIHAHSLIALAPFILYFLFFIFKNQKQDKIVIFLIGLNGLVAAFLLSRQFLAQSHNVTALFSWQIGWMSHDESLLRFYIKNFGMILVFLPVAFYLIRRQMVIWQLTAVSLIWFILPSLMIFQPWDFDNIKLFIYWYFFAAILVAELCIKLLSAGIWQKGVVLGAIFFMTVAGGLDIFRIITSSGTRYPIYQIEAINLANFVKQNTPVDAVFVSADKFDNPVVSLSGRKVVMGFSPWLWTYGLNYSAQQQFTADVLAGKINGVEAKRYGITHVLFFPNVSYTQNQQFFDDHYQLIYDKDGYRIYKL